MAFIIRKKSPAPSGMAAMLAPAAEAEGGEEEASETFKATISEEQMQELHDNGTVTLTAEDGESVVVTMESESPAEEETDLGESDE